MTRDRIRQEVLGAIKDVLLLEVDENTPDSTELYGELEFDSLDAVALVCLLEETIPWCLPSDDDGFLANGQAATGWRTVGDVVNWVSERQPELMGG